MKKSLVSCYYGEVFICSPHGTLRKDIREQARVYFQEKLGKPIIDLPNYKFEIETEWRRRKLRDRENSMNCVYWDSIECIDYDL